MSFWTDLKNRQLGQWTLAYLAGAWLVWQVMDMMGDRWGLTEGLGRVLDLLLIVGFLVTLVLAWYHGEKGRQRVSGPEVLMIGGLLALGVVLLPVVWRSGDSTQAATDTGVEDLLLTPSTDDRPSIAALPFTSTRSDEESTAFATGIHGDVITQ